jgi:CheY-like chemotaxis protein
MKDGGNRKYKNIFYAGKLNKIRSQHPGLEKTIVLLALMASKKVLRIILADDDEDDRDLFEEAISAHAHIQFDKAKDGMELMNKLNSTENVPHIIFLDLNMPGKNGKKCLEEIRSNKKFSHIPVVIYSTSSNNKDIDDTHALGANLYIRKPNSFQELTEVVKKVFSLDWNEYQPNNLKKNFVFTAK